MCTALSLRFSLAFPRDRRGCAGGGGGAVGGEGRAGEWAGPRSGELGPPQGQLLIPEPLDPEASCLLVPSCGLASPSFSASWQLGGGETHVADLDPTK